MGWIGVRTYAACLLACLAFVPSDRAVAAGTPDTVQVESVPARLRLGESRIEAAPATSPRFTLRARFQREEQTGDLREGEGRVLLSRFAKAGASCDASALFRNGFEN